MIMLSGDLWWWVAGSRMARRRFRCGRMCEIGQSTSSRRQCRTTGEDTLSLVCSCCLSQPVGCHLLLLISTLFDASVFNSYHAVWWSSCSPFRACGVHRLVTLSLL